MSRGAQDADPLRVTSGVFALDIEGDVFTPNGHGFSLTTSDLAASRGITMTHI